jgi:nitroimidazol reductase NimA-like FMN-containing flavoprotein (pyridoxamine 5'-phosphate oxidase superfamily)
MSESPIDHLNDEESWDIIQANQIGRIASARDGAPDIYPVSYVVHNWKIYFRTGAESRLRKETDGRVVAFETDAQILRHFSSTVALGVVRTLTNDEAAKVLDQLPIVNFAPDRDYVWMEMDPAEVRGRRLNVLDPRR